MDYDGDGDLDLVVSCPDKPYNGTYFFENPGGGSDPVFRPAVKIGKGQRGARVSHVGDRIVVSTPGRAFREFTSSAFRGGTKIEISEAIAAGRKLRSPHWSFTDYDGDGKHDLVVGLGDWTEYGWDDAYDEKGRWTRGPLHGHVYIARNEGSNEKPRFGKAERVLAGGKPLDVYGRPCPNFADFDDDGDLDLLCGEFRDRLTYFENIGTRRKPRYAAGKFLRSKVDGDDYRMELCMIVPSAIDWDSDGDVDLIVGEEDGRVALVENTGKVHEGLPVFKPPRHFRQEADRVKFGALVTPFGFDWDGDGDQDLVCGNTAGYLAFVENLDGGDPPRWAAPVRLKADGKVIRIQAGHNGSIQGPAEEKWGYTVLSVADWDHDELPDLIVNSIWGKIIWYRNVGTRRSPRLAREQPIEVNWPGDPQVPAWNWWKPKGRELVTQWRSSPLAHDLNGDGLNDLIMLDHEGYLALFERRRDEKGRLELLPPRRTYRMGDGAIYDSGPRKAGSPKLGEPLRLNSGRAGKSGRRKFVLTDWDGDGRVDLLVNSTNVHFLRNIGEEEGRIVYQDRGAVDRRAIGSHTTCPAIVDWDRNGIPDLVAGGEDGYLYYLKSPR